jgi:microcompartment protein CcmL/EutN
MNVSFGYIETRGLVGAIEAADAMVKAAKVRLLNTRRVGAALVTVIVEGELSACQAAVDAGSAAAARIGELISAHVIPNPYPDTEWFTRDLEGGSKPDAPVKTSDGRRSQKQKPKTATKKTAQAQGKESEEKSPEKDMSVVAGLIKQSSSTGISLSTTWRSTGPSGIPCYAISASTRPGACSTSGYTVWSSSLEAI